MEPGQRIRHSQMEAKSADLQDTFNTRQHCLPTDLQNTPILQDVSFTCLAAFPVKLVDFRANAIGKDVKLEWTTASESNNKGFEIQRSLDGRTWVTVGFVAGAGNSNITRNYNYTDRNLNNGKYLYRLKQVDYDNQYNYSGVVNVMTQRQTEFITRTELPESI